MPPWAGIEDDEVNKRMAQGEALPPLKGLNLSPVPHLTEYGLKWNEHERELDFQEILAILRSFRVRQD